MKDAQSVMCLIQYQHNRPCVCYVYVLHVVAVVDIVSAAEPEPQPKVDTRDHKHEPGDLFHRYD